MRRRVGGFAGKKELGVDFSRGEKEEEVGVKEGAESGGG